MPLFADPPKNRDASDGCFMISSSVYLADGFMLFIGIPDVFNAVVPEVGRSSNAIEKSVRYQLISQLQFNRKSATELLHLRVHVG